MRKFYEADVPDLDLRKAETKELKERIRELSQDEPQRLFESLPSDIKPAVQFCLMTGARIATMAGLLWSDINNQTREITFRLKGDEHMTFPISPNQPGNVSFPVRYTPKQCDRGSEICIHAG